jgi:hypothetical protein
MRLFTGNSLIKSWANSTQSWQRGKKSQNSCILSSALGLRFWVALLAHWGRIGVALWALYGGFMVAISWLSPRIGALMWLELASDRLSQL